MSLKILLIDDDVDDRELFTEAISDVDPAIEFDCAKNAGDMLSKLEHSGYAVPDLFLIDINLPEVSGWDCLKMVKNNGRWNNVPVVMYTTSTHDRDRQISRELGADALVTKPADYSELKDILSKVVEAVRKKDFSLIM